MQGNIHSMQGNIQPMQENIHPMQGNIHHMQGNIHSMQGNNLRTVYGFFSDCTALVIVIAILLIPFSTNMRHWYNSKPTLDQRLMFAGQAPQKL